jgi:c-di-GMP-binding flagellar brake protein YcgR
MTGSNLHDERREYFRIKNWIIINHEVVETLEEGEKAGETMTQSSPRITLLQELSQLEKDNQPYLGSLSDKQSQLGNYLINMNKKVSLLTRYVNQSLNTENQDLTEVDISGGGMRFKTHQSHAIDELIKLEIVLVPECVGLVAYGRVVDTKPVDGTDMFEIALIFVKLQEADRESIIKHVFTLQSQQLRDGKKED